MKFSDQQFLKQKFIFFGLMILFVLASATTMAHPIDDLDKISKTEAAFIYLQLGFTHILPLGFDHILFILCLFLLSPKLKPILWQASAFTVAHTITLGLSMYKIIEPPVNIVEPVIALSILYVALENIFSKRLHTGRIGIVFLFGLIHGMGFASALGQLGLPQSNFFSSLLMFNLGVELGQIAVILLAFLLIKIPFSKKPYYRKWIVIPISGLIALTAFYWTIERIFFN